MGKQSARLFYRGKDHKDIYFNGHYHDKMYKGSQLVWEKLKKERITITPLDKADARYNCHGALSGNGILFQGMGSGSYPQRSKDGLNWENAAKLPDEEHRIHSPLSIDGVYFEGYFYFVPLKNSNRVRNILYRTVDGETYELLDKFIFKTGEDIIVSGENGATCAITKMENIGGGYALVTASATKETVSEYFDATNGVFLTKDFKTFINVTKNYGLDPHAVGNKIRILTNKMISTVRYRKEDGLWYFSGSLVSPPTSVITSDELYPGLYSTDDFINIENTGLADRVPSLVGMGAWTMFNSSGRMFTKDFISTYNQLPIDAAGSYPYSNVPVLDNKTVAFASKISTYKIYIYLCDYECTRIIDSVDTLGNRLDIEGVYDSYLFNDKEALFFVSDGAMEYYLIRIEMEI